MYLKNDVLSWNNIHQDDYTKYTHTTRIASFSKSFSLGHESLIALEQ